AAGGADPPVVSRRVEKLYKVAGCTQPNDLQFVPDGLWILDQVDPNKAFKVRPEDGSILQEIQTESIHGSGITYGNGALWIGSTKMTDPAAPPRTLKVDPKTGKTLKSWVTPGSGLYGNVTTPSGAHGLKWVDGKYWMAVPASGKLFLMEPETGAIVRSIPAPGVRTHGLAWDEGFLWCVESDGRVIYKLDRKGGRQDSADENRSRAARPRRQQRRPLVLRRRQRVDLPAWLQRGELIATTSPSRCN